MNPREQQQRARGRHIVLAAVRFGGIALVMAGFAIVRGVIAAPYLLGVALALIGFLDFFFGPWFLSRAWIRHDGEGR